MRGFPDLLKTCGEFDSALGGLLPLAHKLPQADLISQGIRVHRG